MQTYASVDLHTRAVLEQDGKADSKIDEGKEVDIYTQVDNRYIT